MERAIHTKFDIYAYIPTLNKPKNILIGPQDLVLSIVVKLVYWGLGHMESAIHTDA